jgi:GMP synthase (glutamine-hydrolysing)
MALRILLYRNGHTHPDVVRDVGDYREWFSRVVGDRAHLHPHLACEDPRPSTAGLDGVVLTGSPLSLVDPTPWMDDAADFVRRAHDEGVPVLGVCFGHQLIGHAFGGSVQENPRGWESGTHEVDLTDEGRRDPLFRGLPARLRVNQSHRDEVGRLGAGCVRLAGGAHTDNQAIAVGAHVRGVQFHPEMNRFVVSRVIEHRRHILTDDAHRTGRGAHGHADALLARASDTPEAERVVVNFLEHFASRS